MEETLEQRLRTTIGRGHRAVAAGVVHRGVRSTCARGAGEAALFEIGSITKALTGVLLGDMHLRGEVSLDDPLSRHLAAPAPSWRHREPTLLELATHRSGLPNTPGPMGRRELAYAAGIGADDPWAGVTAAGYAELVRRESPRRAPGGRMRYSSMGVGLLGDALAHCAGTTYEALLAERVLRPLGMTSTFVAVPPEREGDLLRGHSRRGRPRPPLEDHMPAAGSLRSTAGDMLRFLAACLAPPADPPGPALALAQRPHAQQGKRMEIGLCWLILHHRGRPSVVWHNGGTWGFRSFAGFSRDRGSAAVVLTNTARGVDRVGLGLVEDPPGG
jgi:serine-type D-Ala-D-Ala carboxypeptidase/endopeptidase